MYDAKIIDDQIAVSGYADGTTWIFPGKGRCAMAGPEQQWLWNLSRDGLRVFDAPSRRLLSEARMSVGPDLPQALTSGDGRLLYLLQKRLGEDGAPIDSECVIVDLASARVLARKIGLPKNARSRLVRCDDGSLLIGAIERRGDRVMDLIVRFDPNDFSTAESAVASARVPDSFTGIHWLGHSLNGRWWLRLDPTHLPMVEVVPAVGEPLRRYYGLTVQLWSAFPLKFKRRIVVAWLKAEDLPDATHIFAPRPHLTPADMLASVPERDRLWETIAAALHRPDAPPDAPMPERAAFGEVAASDDKAWLTITKNLEEFAQRAISYAPRWQPDNQACWFDLKKFMVCMGVDGSVSPRLFTERLGLHRGKMVPFAEGPREPTPQNGRLLVGQISANATRKAGQIVYDGRAVELRYEPVMIPCDQDRFGPQATSVQQEQDRRREVAAMKEANSIVRVDLEGSSIEQRAAALRKLIGMIDQGFQARAYEHTLDLAFLLEDEAIPEARFLSSITLSDRSWAEPLLRELIERYVAVSKPEHTVVNPDNEGLLANALMRLGQMDAAHLPLIIAYGELMDGGHEYYFPGQVLPAIIRHHGWTPPMVTLGLWAMIFNFYNTYDSPVQWWVGLGLGVGLHREAEGSAEAAARLVVERFGERLKKEVRSGTCFAILRRDFARSGFPSAEPWDEDFLTALEDLLPGATFEPD